MGDESKNVQTLSNDGETTSLNKSIGMAMELSLKAIFGWRPVLERALPV